MLETVVVSLGLNKVYGKVNMKGLWDILRIMVRETIYCFPWMGDMSEFRCCHSVGVRQECAMPSWLLSIHIDCSMRGQSRKIRIRLKVGSAEQSFVAGLFVDNTVLLTESEMLHKSVGEFDRGCKRCCKSM